MAVSTDFDKQTDSDMRPSTDYLPLVFAAGLAILAILVSVVILISITDTPFPLSPLSFPYRVTTVLQTRELENVTHLGPVRYLDIDTPHFAYVYNDEHTELEVHDINGVLRYQERFPGPVVLNTVAMVDFDNDGFQELAYERLYESAGSSDCDSLGIDSVQVYYKFKGEEPKILFSIDKQALMDLGKDVPDNRLAEVRIRFHDRDETAFGSSQCPYGNFRLEIKFRVGYKRVLYFIEKGSQPKITGSIETANYIGRGLWIESEDQGWTYIGEPNAAINPFAEAKYKLDDGRSVTHSDTMLNVIRIRPDGRLLWERTFTTSGGSGFVSMTKDGSTIQLVNSMLSYRPQEAFQIFMLDPDDGSTIDSSKVVQMQWNELVGTIAKDQGITGYTYSDSTNLLSFYAAGVNSAYAVHLNRYFAHATECISPTGTLIADDEGTLHLTGLRLDSLAITVDAKTGKISSYGTHQFHPNFAETGTWPSDLAMTIDRDVVRLEPSGFLLWWVWPYRLIVFAIFLSTLACVALYLGIRWLIDRERSRQQLRALTQKTFRRETEIRTKTASLLHDDVAQDLTGLQSTLKFHEQQHDELRAYDGRALSDVVFDLSEKIRAKSHELDTPLSDAPLGLILEQAAQKFRNNYRIQCDVVIPEDLPLVDPKIATTLYSIVREALTNVAKHAHATQVMLRCTIIVKSAEKRRAAEVVRSEAPITDTAPWLSCSISDNGVGIRSRDLFTMNSLGIPSMRERSAAFGGWIEVRPRSEGGTEVSILLPSRTNHNGSTEDG